MMLGKGWYYVSHRQRYLFSRVMRKAASQWLKSSDTWGWKMIFTHRDFFWGSSVSVVSAHLSFRGTSGCVYLVLIIFVQVSRSGWWSGSLLWHESSPVKDSLELMALKTCSASQDNILGCLSCMTWSSFVSYEWSYSQIGLGLKWHSYRIWL